MNGVEPVARATESGTTVDPTELAVRWYGHRFEGVRANMVTSLDGRAAFGGRVRPLSGPTDQALLRALRLFADVVLVGAGTVRAENYGPAVLTEEYRDIRVGRGMSAIAPQIAVVTSRGLLPEQSRLAQSEPPSIIITTRRGRAQAEDTGAQVIAEGTDAVDLRAAVAALRDRGMRHILCEGGPTLLDGLVAADLVDELCLTIAPRFAGNQHDSEIVSGSAPALEVPADMALAHALTVDDFLFLRYERRKADRLDVVAST